MIGLEHHGAIARIVMQRPPVNAIDPAFVENFHIALDNAVRAGATIVVIESDQKCFSAGADLAMIKQYFDAPGGTDAMVDYVHSLHRLFDRIERLEAVTLAVIAGPALGGGLELALACDLRIAVATAKLGLPEAGIGMIPGAGGTQRLPRLAGPGVANRLILSGETVDGREAERLGIVQWVAEPGQLSNGALRISERIAGLARPALLSAKRCLAAALDPTIDGYARELEQPRHLMHTKEARERIAAFFATRSR
jgi:enoyl-CoA hydratase/carnithine racemase